MTTSELISKIKENIYSGNRGTCDYFIVDEIEDLIYEYEESGGCAKYIDHSQPERKTGRWERHYSRPNVYTDLWWHCSVCGYKNADQYANRYHHYCPKCGSLMEVENEQTKT